MKNRTGVKRLNLNITVNNVREFVNVLSENSNGMEFYHLPFAN